MPCLFVFFILLEILEKLEILHLYNYKEILILRN